jgi:hypothetical protein
MGRFIEVRGGAQQPLATGHGHGHIAAGVLDSHVLSQKRETTALARQTQEYAGRALPGGHV